MIGTGIITTIWNKLCDIADAMHEARAAYDIYFKLSSMPDSSLEKLGLERSDLPRIAFARMKGGADHV